MIIQDIKVIPLKMPVDTLGEGGFQGTNWNSIHLVLLKIETKDGAIGWGEAFGYACWRPVVWALQEMFIPLLIGKSVENIDELMHSLQKQMHTYGRYGIGMFALSGIDIALWDLKAKLANKPLYVLLKEADEPNATAPKLTAYASLFKYGDSQPVRKNCRRALELGYTAIKLHENREEEIAAARDEVGPDVPLTTDVNCCWTAAEAQSAAKKFKPYNLMWLEEPVFPPEDYEALAGLRQQIPIAAGENACTVYEFQRMLDLAAVDYAQPSVTKVGGITEFIKIVELLKRHKKVRLAPHSAYFGPGLQATIHLAAAQKDASKIMIERFFIEPEADMFDGMLSPKEGFYQPSHLPGLGPEPDADVIKEYQIAQ